MSVLAFMACHMSGCGKQQEHETITTYNKKTWYREEHSSLNVYYEQAIIKNDMIYGVYYKENKPMIVCQNKQTLEVEREIPVDSNLIIANIQVDCSGKIYFVAEKDRIYKFYTINELNECVELADLYIAGKEGELRGEVKRIYIDDQNHYYVWQSASIPIEKLFPEDGRKDGYVDVDQIYVLDSQFQILCCKQIPQFQGTELVNFYLGQDGTGLLLIKDETGIYTQKMDLEEESVGEKYYLDGIKYENTSNVFAASKEGILYCYSGKLYEYNFETKIQTELLNLSTYGLLSEDLLYIGKTEETIEIINTYRAWEISEYTTLIPGESNKKVLTMGVMMQSPDIQSIVASFNRYSKDYIVDIVEYYDKENGYTGASDKMKLDIISGNAPDIIDVSGVDVSILSNKGLLVDLYSLMEQDEDFSKERLISSVIKAYENGGHLYCISPAFHLVTMWGSNEVIQGEKGVSLQKLMNILNASGKDLNAIFGFSADEPVLTTLCTFGMDEFIDWDNKKCNFTGKYFGDVLEFVKNYSGTYSGSQSKGIQEGNIVMTTGIIDSVAGYQTAKELYGEEVAFIGYPTNNGSGTAVTFREVPLAISAKQEYIEGAWDFVKFYIINGYKQRGFPIEVNQFEATMSFAMQPDFVVDLDGETIKIPKTVYSDKDTRILIYEASEEDVRAVKDLISSVTNKFEYNVPIMQIISEEAETYLQGGKTLGEVTKIIQNRVRLYLSEN